MIKAGERPVSVELDDCRTALLQSKNGKLKRNFNPSSASSTLALSTIDQHDGPAPRKKLKGNVPPPKPATVPTDGRGSSVSDRQLELKKRNETFLLFTRVLLKYLEKKDPAVHQKSKLIVKDCAERKKRGERGYESVTEAMRTRLKQVVAQAYWQRAEAYLRQLLEKKGTVGMQQVASKAATNPPKPETPSPLSVIAPSFDPFQAFPSPGVHAGTVDPLPLNPQNGSGQDSLALGGKSLNTAFVMDGSDDKKGDPAEYSWIRRYHPTEEELQERRKCRHVFFGN